MSFIEKSLSKNETVHQIFKHHWIVKLFLVLHLILCLTVIWIPIAISYWLKWKFIEQGVTNKRVISKHGIISRKTDEMRLSAIESIVITQGIWGRILGFGEVKVVGRGAGDVVIRWMSNPVNVKKVIEDAEEDRGLSS